MNILMNILMNKNQGGIKMKHHIVYLSVMLLLASWLLTGELTANVTNIKVVVNPTEFKGQCPKMFTFTGSITSNAAGVVKYQWKRSDGAIAPVQMLNFKKPGTLRVQTTWTLGGAGKEYTEWQAIEILEPIPMISEKGIFKLQCDNPALTIKPGVIIKPGKIDPGQIAPYACPDPAAFEIRFDIVRSYTQFKKRIKITGYIKNIGAGPFNSGPNQAAAYLYEIPAGAASGRELAHQAIINLAAGATMQLTYERDWDSSSPSEGEFPPNYRLQILLDPDIYMDANKANDDCNQNNNRKDRNGMDINSMITH